MYLAIVSCTNNWIVIKLNMNSQLLAVLFVPSAGWTQWPVDWISLIPAGCVWQRKALELRLGWGSFHGAAHTQQPLCLPVFSWAGGDACSADMSVSAAHFQITLSVCANMGRSVWTWLAAEWQGLVLKAGMLVRCSTIPPKPCGTNLLKCVRINMMQVP